MITHEQLLAMWEEDAVIEKTQLDRESLSIPKLHHKYLSILMEIRTKKDGTKQFGIWITNDEADEIIFSLSTKGKTKLAQNIMHIRTRANALLRGNINENE